MDDKYNAVSIDDLFEASAAGVLRALRAREEGSGLELVRNGFFVDIHIIAGGLIGPWLDRIPGQPGGLAGRGKEGPQT